MSPKNRPLKKTVKKVQHQFEKMLAWATSPQASRLAGKPYLVERDGVLALHFDELSIQSEMSIDAPDELVIGYTKAMMSFLLLNPTPQRIAMIGLGGGSLAKYCYRHLPQSDITVVEINPDVIALRDEFAIPADDARFKILLEDGAKFVTQPALQQDVLIVDGFDADGINEQLSSQAFYDHCYAALSENGILVVNLWGGYPHYDEYLARIQQSFDSRVVVVDAEDSENKIVLAVKSSAFPPAASTIRHHANLLCASHPLNFKGKSNRLIRALAS